MDTQQLWQAILGELELVISKANFTTWFKKTAISTVENGKVVICVPNAFTQAWLEKKYHSAILKAFQKITNNEIKEVIYKVENINHFKYQESTSSATLDRHAFQTSTAAPNSISTNNGQIGFNNEFGINPKYTFSSFVVGKSNDLAHAASVAVASRPGEAYNPLFIYGGVGLGKTHLLHAVGLEIKRKKPTTKILYASCEKFTNDYINMVKTGKAKQFQEIYRNVDLLLMDDIQFITGKEGTQEAFFHTFNALHQKNKQIIITSDRPPKAISTLESRLISRFEWGMIADIQTPDLETRIAILEAKCNEKSYPLSQEIINYIATNIQSNIREVEGALNRVIAHHQLQGTRPTLQSVKAILTSLTSTYPKKTITPKQLISVVSQFYDIEIEYILGSSRKKELVMPRQIIMYLMRTEIQSSYPAIGQELGGRDHTTAMHAFDKIKQEIENNEKVRQEINFIKQRLYNR